MSVRLCDIQAGYGGLHKGERQVLPAESLLEAMRRLTIDAALVRLEPDASDVDFQLSNELLFKACDQHPELVPCPVAVPATAYDLPPEPEQTDAVIRRGACAAMVRPSHDDWEPLPCVYERLLAAMADRQLPLYCALHYVPFAKVAEFAEYQPNLPIIITQAGYRSQRTIVPLLETYPNVHLAIGANWTIHRGIEQMVERVGAEKLLFGTGYPAAEPMMAVTQLMYAQISDEQKTLIGAGNFERLAAGVKS